MNSEPDVISCFRPGRLDRGLLLLLLCAAAAPGCGDDGTGDMTPAATACEELCAAASGCGAAAAMGLPADPAACAATCAPAASGPVDCIVDALTSERCDQVAAEACVPRDAELPVPVHEYVTPAGPQLGFVPLQLLGCSATGCESPMLVYDSAGVLPAVVRHLEPRLPGAELFVAVEPGQAGEPYIILDTVAQQELFAGQDIVLDAEGVYTVREMAASDTGCALTGSALPEGDLAFNGQPGGICGGLAIAHSLVYRLDVVNEDWDGVRDGDNWDPDFLRGIQMATGDDDGNRGIDQNEMDMAHEADWNARWKVEQSLDWTTVPGASGQDRDCAELEEWCNTLVEHQADEDCILFLQGMQSSGEYAGHYITITSASWDAESCQCRLEAVNTGKQDGDAHDFSGVPVDPGKHTWVVGQGSQITVSEGPAQNFWNHVINFDRAHVACYDEEARIEWPWETLENGPGPAFPGQ